MATAEAHSDPDTIFDKLPQPYRMIWKIIEFDILDKAWFEIIRLHPDAQTDYSGNLPASSKRAQKMEAKCLPSSLTEQYVTYTSIRGGYQYLYMASSLGTVSILDSITGKILGTIGAFKNTVESVISINHIAYTSGRLGKIERLVASCISIPAEQTSSQKTYQCEISILDVDVEEVQRHQARAFTCVDDGVKIAPRVSFSLCIENILDPLDLNVSITVDGGILTVTNGVTLELYALTSQVKNDTQVLVVEAGKQSPKQSPRYMTIKEDIEITEFKNVGTIVLEQPTARLDILPFSLYHRLTTEENDKPSANDTSAHNISSPMKPPVASAAAPSTSSGSSGNKKKSAPGSASAAPPVAVPIASKRPAPPIPRVDKPRVFQHFLFPLTPTALPSKSVPFKSQSSVGFSATASLTKQDIIAYISNFGIAIIWAGVSEWCILGLSEAIGGHDEAGVANTKGKSGQSSKVPPKQEVSKVKPPSTPKSPEPPTAKSRATSPHSRKNSSKDGNATGTVEVKAKKSVTDQNLKHVIDEPLEERITLRLCLHEMQRWALSSDTSMMCTDEQRALMVIGKSDGCVTFWDLRGMILCGGDFGRHETAVTQMVFTVGNHVRLVSGCVDGSVCFFSVETGPESSTKALANQPSSKALSIPKPNTVFGSYRVSLVQFHQDIRAPIVSMTNIPRSSLVVVVTGKGNLLLYDGDAMDLLGSIVTRSLQLGMPSVWRPVSHALVAGSLQERPTTRLMASPEVMSKRMSGLDPSAMRKRKSVEYPPVEDFPVGWPDLHLDPAGGNSTALVRILQKLAPIGGACCHGYAVLYRDVATEGAGKPGPGPTAQGGALSVETRATESEAATVLTCYTINQILTALFPGIVSILSEVRGSGQYDLKDQKLNPIVLSSMLTESQRLDSNLKIAEVEGLEFFLSMSRQHDPTLTRTRSTLRAPSVHGGDSHGSRSRPTSSNGSKSKIAASQQPVTTSDLTEKKLQVFNSIVERQGGGSAQALPTVVTEQYLRLMNWENTKTPEAMARQARMRSQQERAARASKLMSHLSDLADWFE